MREEWSDPIEAAFRHRALLVERLDRIRARLDEFAPDLVVVWGDDQYELFREEIVPPFCVLAFNDTIAKPHEFARGANVWGEPPDTEITLHMNANFGKYFVERLLEHEIDIAYAYRPREGVRFPHAFMNTALYLDYHRDRGFPYTMLPISVNCYGRKVIADRGFRPNFGNDAPLDPPSPTPGRCMRLGAAVARIAAESSLRVALVASAGWSHANLTDATWRMRPDVDSDRALFQAMRDKDYGFWHRYTTIDIERAGQQEVLNWFCLLGAMEELGMTPAWTDLVESYIFNSTKVFAIYE